jgi:hypothetical protein
MKNRIMWLMLPVMCMVTAVMCIGLIPFAIVFGIVFMIKPELSGKMTAPVQRRIARHFMKMAFSGRV